MIPNIGPMEVGIVLVVAMIIFGPKKIPELAKSVGSSVREFRSSVSGAGEEKVEAPQEMVEAEAEAKAEVQRDPKL